jgi:hypothetical protein
MPRPIAAKAIVRQATNSLYPDAGCSDGSCIFGHSGGMQTNDGCQCIKGSDEVAHRRNLLRLSDIARELATALREAKADRDRAIQLLHMLDRPEARHPDVAEFLDEYEARQLARGPNADT